MHAALVLLLAVIDQPQGVHVFALPVYSRIKYSRRFTHTLNLHLRCSGTTRTDKINRTIASSSWCNTNWFIKIKPLEIKNTFRVPDWKEICVCKCGMYSNRRMVWIDGSDAAGRKRAHDEVFSDRNRRRRGMMMPSAAGVFRRFGWLDARRARALPRARSISHARGVDISNGKPTSNARNAKRLKTTPATC